MPPRSSWKTTAAIMAVAVIGLIVLGITDGQDGGTAAETIAAAADSTTFLATAEGGESFAVTVLPALLKMAAALTVVVACIYLGLFLLKRMMGKRYPGRRVSGKLEVLETTFVAPKKSLSLVRVADKAVLIGITETHMTMLTELDQDQTAELLAEPEQTVAVATDSGFDQFLGKATRQLNRLRLRRSGSASEA